MNGKILAGASIPFIQVLDFTYDDDPFAGEGTGD